MTAFSTLYILQLVKSLAFHIPRIGHHREYHPPPPPPEFLGHVFSYARKVQVYAWIVEHLTVRVVALFGNRINRDDLITPKSHGLIFPHVRKSQELWMWNCGLWNPESWAWKSRIEPKESEVWNPGIQNPSSTDKGWNPVRGIRNSRRGI